MNTLKTYQKLCKQTAKKFETDEKEILIWGLGIAGEAGDALPDAVAGFGPLHPPAEQRLHGEGEEGGLVAPVFEQAALLSPGLLVQQLAVIGALAREGRQVVGAGDHVDAVDLDDAEAVGRLAEVAAGGSVGPRFGEALGG